MLQDVYRIRDLSRQLIRLLDVLKGRYREAAQTYPQAHAMMELQSRGQLHANDLADILRMDKSSISRTVKELLRQKLVRTTTTDADRRYKLIQLTKRGEQEAVKLHTLGNSHIGHVLSILSPDDVRSVVHGLEVYVHALQRHEWLSQITIRPITTSDNLAMADIIKSAMTEFGAVGPGYSIMDEEVNAMCEAYAGKRCAYWVAERAGVIIGGAGIAPLTDGDGDTCELKKMYFRAEARGKGLGHRLIQACLQKARELRYRRCYLETLQRMTAANRLYEKHGFEKLSKPMGHTGHYKTDHWYVRNL